MIGTQELIVILIVALFLFGPQKLPELARSLGSAMGEFKKAQRASELELNQFDAYTRKAANTAASEEKEKGTEQKDTPSSSKKTNTDTELETGTELKTDTELKTGTELKTDTELKTGTDTKIDTDLENKPEAGKSVSEQEELRKI